MMTYTRPLLVAAMLAAAACAPNTSTTTTPETPTETPKETPKVEAKQKLTGQQAQDALVVGQQAFGADLFAKTHATSPNVLLSPYSVHVALGMTSVGAKGQTVAQMNQALGLGELDLAAYKAQSDALAKQATADTPEPLVLNTANRLFVQDGYKLVPAFTSTVEAAFGALPEAVNFIKDTEAARTTINAWVSKQTMAKIPELIKAGVLSGATRMVLTNAVYFKGAWQHPFGEGSTTPMAFEGAAAPVPTMQVAADFATGEAGGARLLSMPYQGGDADMLIILPPAGQADALASKMNGAALGEMLKAPLKTGMTRVRLPKFTYRTPIKLNDTLQAMGIKDAFSQGSADFTGMNPDAKKEGLHISAVIHEAFIAVDEKGTEAAAATAVAVAVKGIAPTKPAEFFVDRPFLFVIRHTKTNTPLFLGKVTKP